MGQSLLYAFVRQKESGSAYFFKMQSETGKVLLSSLKTYNNEQECIEDCKKVIHLVQTERTKACKVEPLSDWYSLIVASVNKKGITEKLAGGRYYTSMEEVLADQLALLQGCNGNCVLRLPNTAGKNNEIGLDSGIIDYMFSLDGVGMDTKTKKARPENPTKYKQWQDNRFLFWDSNILREKFLKPFFKL